ncbi:MAG: hypothetical protein KatS3mg060_0650 [Dehalococcoidia bacterium]|nr:MAG: hypothetical protein KatS3mg060_0650 [Dehalococcoidia bacterium]
MLASANPGVGVDGWQAALATTGKPILDTRNGVTKRRIDVYQAVCSLAPCSGAPTATATATSTRTSTPPAPDCHRDPYPSATADRDSVTHGNASAATLDSGDERPHGPDHPDADGDEHPLAYPDAGCRKLGAS